MAHVDLNEQQLPYDYWDVQSSSMETNAYLAWRSGSSLALVHWLWTRSDLCLSVVRDYLQSPWLREKALAPLGFLGLEDIYARQITAGKFNKITHVLVKWARPLAHSILHFEAWAMRLMAEIPVNAAARELRENDTRMWRIFHHYVDKAMAELDLSRVKDCDRWNIIEARGIWLCGCLQKW